MAKRAIDVEAHSSGPLAPHPKRNHYVFRHGDGWAVRVARARRITSEHPTRDEAIEAAKALAWPEADVICESFSGKYRHMLTKDPLDELVTEMWRTVREDVEAGRRSTEWPYW